MNQTAIYITWNTIPILYQNGVVQNYSIAYKEKISSEDWKFISVDSHKRSVEIGHLHDNKVYDVKVAGSTAIGQGPYSAAISIRADAYGMKFIMILIVTLAILITSLELIQIQQ